LAEFKWDKARNYSSLVTDKITSASKASLHTDNFAGHRGRYSLDSRERLVIYINSEDYHMVRADDKKKEDCKKHGLK
jgi:hypothetical protein